MILVQVASGIPPQQVDDFGAGVERSVKGAVYFRPNTLRSLTKGEYEHICKAHSHLASKLRVIKDTDPNQVRVLKPVVESNPEPDVPPDSEP
jgi:hypothetical protein